MITWHPGMGKYMPPLPGAPLLAACTSFESAYSQQATVRRYRRGAVGCRDALGVGAGRVYKCGGGAGRGTV